MKSFFALTTASVTLAVFSACEPDAGKTRESFYANVPRKAAEVPVIRELPSAKLKNDAPLARLIVEPDCDRAARTVRSDAFTATVKLVDQKCDAAVAFLVDRETGKLRGIVRCSSKEADYVRTIDTTEYRLENGALVVPGFGKLAVVEKSNDLELKHEKSEAAVEVRAETGVVLATDKKDPAYFLFCPTPSKFPPRR